MKMILVSRGGDFAAALSYHLKPLGFTLEHHTDPVRVIEQLDEYNPQAILFNAADFPRHWKPLLMLARDRKSREELIFLLIAPPDMEIEDVQKAAHLGVNGILGQDLADKQELYRLEEIVRRYHTVSDKRNFTRLVPRGVDELGFAFTHPNRLALVTGRVREISIQGSSFRPARTEPWQAMVPQMLSSRSFRLKAAPNSLSSSARSRSSPRTSVVPSSAGTSRTTTVAGPKDSITRPSSSNSPARESRLARAAQ